MREKMIEVAARLRQRAERVGRGHLCSESEAEFQARLVHELVLLEVAEVLEEVLNAQAAG